MGDCPWGGRNGDLVGDEGLIGCRKESCCDCRSQDRNRTWSEHTYEKGKCAPDNTIQMKLELR